VTDVATFLTLDLFAVLVRVVATVWCAATGVAWLSGAATELVADVPVLACKLKATLLKNVMAASGAATASMAQLARVP
jgi:hypothetical protein